MQMSFLDLAKVALAVVWFVCPLLIVIRLTEIRDHLRGIRDSGDGSGHV